MGSGEEGPSRGGGGFTPRLEEAGIHQPHVDRGEGGEDRWCRGRSRDRARGTAQGSGAPENQRDGVKRQGCRSETEQ